MTLVDIGLFLQSARTDARIATLRTSIGARAAFETAYAGGADPWASTDRRYSYQRWKYEALIGLLPPGRRFSRALDLGSGTGTLSLALAGIADSVLGLDIAQSAVDGAAALCAGRAGVSFRQADVGSLDPALDGGFDLVVVADTLYYLDSVDDVSLKNLAMRLSRLLSPGGICLLANHYFFSGDRESRLTRRIHDAFVWSPGFVHLATHRRPFFLASLLEHHPTTRGHPPDKDSRQNKEPEHFSTASTHSERSENALSSPAGMAPLPAPA